MTNKEAIRRILDHKRVHSLNESRAVLINEALDLAIKALEQTEVKGDLISREALKKEMDKKAFDLANGGMIFIESINHIIDKAPTVETEITNEDLQNAMTESFKNGYEMAKAKYERTQGEEWIDYSNTFYKCPECGYLLEKDCPRCQTKVILPKGGEEE